METITFKKKQAALNELETKGFTFYFAPDDRKSAFYGAEIWVDSNSRTAALWYPPFRGNYGWIVDFHPH